MIRQTTGGRSTTAPHAAKLSHAPASSAAASLLIMPGMPQACLGAAIRLVPVPLTPAAISWERERLARTGAPAPGTTYLLARATRSIGQVVRWIHRRGRAR